MSRFVTRHFPYSLAFDGDGDYLDCNDNFDKERTDSFSFSFYFNPRDLTSNQTIFQKRDNGGAGYEVVYGITDGQIGVQIEGSNGNLIDVETSDLTPINKWSFITITYDGSSNASGVEVYRDTNPLLITISTDTLDANITNATDFRIGIRDNGTLDFNGRITDFRIHNAKLTKANIDDAYFRNIHTSVEGYFPFTEGTGTTATDSVGSVAGTLNNATWSKETPFLKRFVPRAISSGNTLNFNGSSSDGASDTAVDFSAFTDITIAYWFKAMIPPAATGVVFELSDNINNNAGVFANFTTTDGSLTCSCRKAAVNNFVGTENISDGKWHRIVTTYRNNFTSGATVVYVDGRLLGGSVVLSNISPTTWASGETLFLGARNAASSFGDFQTTSLEFYNDRWTADEVSDEYFLDIKPSTAASFRFKMDEGTGANIADDIGGENISLTQEVWDTDTPSAIRVVNSTTRTAVADLLLRVPVKYRDLGLTDVWDFRTGFVNDDDERVVNVLSGLDMFWQGSTALSSVYTTDEFSVDLNGTDDYFDTIVTREIDEIEHFTIFGWVKRGTTNTRDPLLAMWETGTNNRFFILEGEDNGNLRLVFDEDGGAAGNVLQTSDSAVLNDTDWHFIGATWTGDAEAELYLDGALTASTESGGTTPSKSFNGAAKVEIGAVQDASLFLDGKIGICGFTFKKKLSTAEMLELYNITKLYMRQ